VHYVGRQDELKIFPGDTTMAIEKKSLFSSTMATRSTASLLAHTKMVNNKVIAGRAVMGDGLQTAKGGGLNTTKGGGLNTTKGGGLNTTKGGGLNTTKGGGLNTTKTIVQ
jgi:hypothetical protein